MIVNRKPNTAKEFVGGNGLIGLTAINNMEPLAKLKVSV